MANQYEMCEDVLVVRLQGALKSTDALQIEAEILRRLDEGANQLLLDLSALDYISSAGLRVVLVAAKRLKQSAGELTLCGLRSQVRTAFELVGFMKILAIAETRADALERFGQFA